MRPQPLWSLIYKGGEASMNRSSYNAVLEVLCTLPEARGRGAAKMHLKWGEDLARKGGMPIWLDASPVGLGLYEKEGFTFVEEVVTDLTEWGGEGSCVHTCMIKECVKVGEEGRDG